MKLISKRKLKELNYKFSVMPMWQKATIAVAGLVIVSAVFSLTVGNAVAYVTNREVTQQVKADENNAEKKEAEQTNTALLGVNFKDENQEAKDAQQEDEKAAAQNVRKMPSQSMLDDISKKEAITLEYNGDEKEMKAQEVQQDTAFVLDGTKAYTTCNIVFLPQNLSAGLKELKGSSSANLVITDALEVDSSYQFLINKIENNTNEVFILITARHTTGYKLVKATNDMILKFTDGQGLYYEEQH